MARRYYVLDECIEQVFRDCAPEMRTRIEALAADCYHQTYVVSPDGCTSWAKNWPSCPIGPLPEGWALEERYDSDDLRRLFMDSFGCVVCGSKKGKRRIDNWRSEHQHPTFACERHLGAIIYAGKDALGEFWADRHENLEATACIVLARELRYAASEHILGEMNRTLKS